MTEGRVLMAAILLVAGAAVHAQRIDDDRVRGVRMLRDIRTELRIHYHDPAFHWVDVDAHFEKVEARIREAASQGEINGLLAQALMIFGDSHTFFIPPPHATEVDYGFILRMVGDRCLVMAVKPESFAAADALHAGDVVRTVEGVTPSRETLWQIMYALQAVRHRRELRVTLQSAGGPIRDAVVRSRVTTARPFQRFEDWVEALLLKLESRRSLPIRTASVGTDGVVIRLTSFDIDDKQIDQAMERVRNKRALILDLRENPGGSVDTLRRVAGYFFERPITIGELRGRKQTEKLESVRRPADRVFRGKIVVLVDSASGSAAEVLARVLQLRGRATIIGDRTAGAVMVSRPHLLTVGNEARFVIYGVSISERKLLMSDGASIERIGVVPDELLLPTPEDLAAGLDTVLARAAAMLDLRLDAKAAGALLPREWP